MAELNSRAEGHAKQVNIGGDNYAPIDISGMSRSALVVVGDIPRQPLGFVKRLVFQDLKYALEGSSNSSVCVLTGMRGVGKTQIAAAYAREAIDCGEGVVGWINAETPLNLLSGLMRLAQRLGIADIVGDSNETARRLREHLASLPGPKLIVFDNTCEPDTVAPYLNSLGSTRVIITSTDRRFTEIGTTPIDVESYTRGESIEYLGSRTGIVDKPGANCVAEELGDLPLALAAAAATIFARRYSYSEYVALLRKRSVGKVLQRQDGQSYRISVESALLLALRSVQKHDHDGLITRLLVVMSMLSTQGVGTRILHRLTPGVTDFRRAIIFHTFSPPAEDNEEDIDEIIGQNTLELVLHVLSRERDKDGTDPLLNFVPGESGSELFDRAIERCVSGSVLSYSAIGTDVIMHRLTARVIRETFTYSEVENYFDTPFQMALDVVEPDLSIAEQPERSLNDIANAAIHIETLWENAKGQVQSPELLRRALEVRDSAVLLLAHHSIDIMRAIQMGKSAVTDAERLFGSDDPAVRAARFSLGFAYLRAGEPAIAISLAEHNLADAERLRISDKDDEKRLNRVLLARAHDDVR